MTELFASDLRRRLYVLVQDYPGLHVRELARCLDVKVRAVEYHSKVLLDEGVLEDLRDGAYHRLFPSRAELPLTDAEREALGVLRMRTPLALVLALLDVPDGLSHSDLRRRLGASKSNTSHHLKRLRSCGLVVADGVYRLAEPDKTRRLLRTHKPLPDLRQRFADTWSSLYRM